MDFKIAIVPINSKIGDKKHNLGLVEKALGGLPAETDLVVLPELFSTGFINDEKAARLCAEPASGETIARLKILAKKHNLAIAGSYLATIGNSLSNRGFFIEPSGDEIFYEKRHLFCLSPEAKHSLAGEKEIPVIRFRGWSISMVICYDLRFPVWCRNRNNEYELLIVPANWPEVRRYAWEHLLIARAIENQAYVAGANRSGSDDYGVYDNLSFIYSPMGKPVGEKMADGTVVATLTKKSIEEIRHKLPAVKDADSFSIEL